MRKREGVDVVQTAFDLTREKHKAFRDKADKNGQKLVWILNRFVDYYLEHGVPEKEVKNGK